MLISTTVIFLYTIFVQSPFQDNINLRVDCYKSYSDPVVFIKLQHYYPSGPLALSAVFSYKRYYLLSGFIPETEIGQYYFSRYDFQCNTSAIFTTGGILFIDMDVNIKIYLLSEQYLIANIQYIFYRGFKPGEYKLLDNYQNFALKLKILDTKEKYLDTQRKLNEIFKFFIESISDTRGELCIVTENNRAAIVKLKKGLVLPGGYIFGLSAYDYPPINDNIYANYPTFLCQTHDFYYQERVIFITEKNKMDKSFCIINLKSFINDEAIFTRMKIEIDHPNFQSIDILQKIPSIYNKIFIFPYFFGPISKNCSDGSKVTPLLFEDNVEFLAYMYMFVEITTGIKVYASFITSSSDSCGEEK